MKKFVKGVRFAPKNYSDEVEAKIQHYKREGYKLPSRHLLRTEEQLAGIRESARINTALLDYISENIREGMSTAEIDHMVYCFTTDHDAIPAPFLYEGFPKSVCVSINDVVCHGIPSTKEFLRSGDIVNVDVSTIYKGYFSDASRMYMIGEVSPEMQRLVQVTRECRDIGIQALQLIPVTRDGDLPVAVVIDRPDMVIGGTEPLNRLVRQLDNGRHGGVDVSPGPRHACAARTGKAEARHAVIGPGKGQRRDLAEREARNSLRLQAAVAPGVGGGKIGQVQAGLRVCGLAQLVIAPGEHLLQRAGAKLLRSVKQRADGGKMFIEFLPHAGALRALPGEQKSGLSHSRPSFLDSFRL